jgi:hypothetical protein
MRLFLDDCIRHETIMYNTDIDIVVKASSSEYRTVSVLLSI